LILVDFPIGLVYPCTVHDCEFVPDFADGYFPFESLLKKTGALHSTWMDVVNMDENPCKRQKT